MTTRKPTRAQRERAVTLARLYAGSQGACSVRQQQKLYDRLQRAIAPLERFASDASAQVWAQAQALGPLMPMPGKDI